MKITNLCLFKVIQNMFLLKINSEICVNPILALTKFYAVFIEHFFE